jgi:TolB protein
MVLHPILLAAGVLLLSMAGGSPDLVVGAAEMFAPGIASTRHAEIRLTISPDGRTALWFSRDRPGGPGGYDIWMSRRTAGGWGAAVPVPFNSDKRDFDPAFSRDGRFVYFCSDRPGGVGRDDIFRVAVTPHGFGVPENLGASVNSAASEWAPMLAPDGSRLLFSSDRPGGAGRQDLFAARRRKSGFAPALPIPGAVNTAADEFDATFLGDSATIVFSRAPDLMKDRVDLFAAAPEQGRYGSATALAGVNSAANDTYAPMLDWSQPGRLTFSARRQTSHGEGMDLYVVGYRLGGR